MYTQEQLDIINHDSGHVRVTAVPGSGKTHAMIGRVVRLLASNIPARRIAVVMFNAQAATDFFKRLQKAIHSDNQIEVKKDRMPVVRTLHSLAARMIQTLIQNDYLPNYTFDPDKSFLQRTFLKEALKELNCDDSLEIVEQMQSAISLIKSRCDEIISFNGDVEALEVQVFKAYEKIRHHNKMRFFDDLLYDTAMAVKQKPELINLLGNKVRHVIVDEFQDINPCQMELIKIIAGTKADVMIVGDVNQSIYGFRGAEPKIMLEDFSKAFNKVTDYSLSTTFRFGQSLSDLANQSISFNENRFDIRCQSNPSAGETEIYVLSESEYNPVSLITQKLHNNYSKTAVLVREFSHKIKTEMALLKAGIPYQVVGGESILNHKAVISLLGYLRLADEAQNLQLLTPSEREHTISCMLNMPALSIHRSLKKQLVNRLTEVPDNENIFLDVADQLKRLPNLKDDDLAKQLKNIARREEIWGNALFYDGSASAYLILKDLYKNQLKYDRYFDFTSSKSIEASYKKALLEELIVWANELQGENVSSIDAFIEHIDCCKKAYDDRIKEGRKDCLTITSMHGSKGLEWDHVILPELLHENFPVSNNAGEIEDIEGDRRLFYVAITRARKNVYLIGGNDIEKIKQYAQGEELPENHKFKSSRFLYESYINEESTCEA